MAAEEARGVEVETEELQTKDGPLRDLTIKINVDVADALKGLKAVQREARVATQTVAELGDVEAEKLYTLIADRIKEKGKNPVYYLSGLRDSSTADLVEELGRRDGVMNFIGFDGQIRVGNGEYMTLPRRKRVMFIEEPDAAKGAE